MEHRVVHVGLALEAFPIWVPTRADGRLVPISPTQLGISAELDRDLARWAERYNENADASGQDLKFPPGVLQELHDAGHELWQRLIDELGRECEVHYDSPLYGESWRVHRP